MINLFPTTENFMNNCVVNNIMDNLIILNIYGRVLILPCWYFFTSSEKFYTVDFLPKLPKCNSFDSDNLVRFMSHAKFISQS